MFYQKSGDCVQRIMSLGFGPKLGITVYGGYVIKKMIYTCQSDCFQLQNIAEY